MRKILFTAILVFSTVLAAGDPQWETDYEVAKSRAEKENKSILINFTGSDWCGWCKKLDKEVFRTDDFNVFVNDNLVLLKVDFPKFTKLTNEQVKANEKMAYSFGVRGFPTIYLVDEAGKIKLQTGYVPGGSPAYIKHLKGYL